MEIIKEGFWGPPCIWSTRNLLRNVLNTSFLNSLFRNDSFTFGEDRVTIHLTRAHSAMHDGSLGRNLLRVYGITSLFNIITVNVFYL